MIDLLLSRLCITTAAVVVPAAILWCACGEIEPEPPTDDDGEPIPMPDPMEDWLRFESVDPDEELSVQPTIAIEFNQYLDVNSFRSFGTARLESGGHIRGGNVDYRMTRKQLLFRPNQLLQPGLTYELVWRQDDVESVIGSPLYPQVELPDELTVSADAEPTGGFSRPSVGWDDVEPLFEAHCNECHGDDGWQLPELTRDGLVGTRSEQVDAMLVEPYHPARSYLMHKILPDYPVRKHTVQPPPYSEQAGALSIDDIELIEHWIAGGARR